MNSQDTMLPPDMETSSTRKPLGPWATAGFGLVIMSVFGFTQVMVLLIVTVGIILADTSIDFAQLGDILMENLGLLTSIATCASAVVCIGIVILIIKIRRGATITEYLGFKAITGKTVLITLAYTAGIIVLLGYLGVSLDKPVPDFMVSIYTTSVWPLLLWIAIVIFGPAFEEIFFRGFLFEGFRHTKIGIPGTIGLTAFTWSILHIQYGVFEIATIFFLGIIMGIARYKTDSLWTPLIIHVFFNLVAMIELVLYLKGIIS